MDAPAVVHTNHWTILHTSIYSPQKSTTRTNSLGAYTLHLFYLYRDFNPKNLSYGGCSTPIYQYSATAPTSVKIEAEISAVAPSAFTYNLHELINLQNSIFHRQ